MQRRGQRGRAAISPLQVQRFHQARPPGLFDGMAVPLSEEVLRALQNPVSVYEAVFAKYATTPSRSSLLSPLRGALDATSCNVAEVLFGGGSLAGLPSLCHQTGVEASLLVQ